MTGTNGLIFETCTTEYGLPVRCSQARLFTLERGDRYSRVGVDQIMRSLQMHAGAASHMHAAALRICSARFLATVICVLLIARNLANLFCACRLDSYRVNAKASAAPLQLTGPTSSIPAAMPHRFHH